MLLVVNTVLQTCAALSDDTEYDISIPLLVTGQLSSNSMHGSKVGLYNNGASDQEEVNLAMGIT
jgi:hypothetical protein